MQSIFCFTSFYNSSPHGSICSHTPGRRNQLCWGTASTSEACQIFFYFKNVCYRTKPTFLPTSSETSLSPTPSPGFRCGAYLQLWLLSQKVGFPTSSATFFYYSRIKDESYTACDASGEDKHKRLAPTLRKYVKTSFDMKIDLPVSLIYSDSALHNTSGCCHTHAAEEK